MRKLACGLLFAALLLPTGIAGANITTSKPPIVVSFSAQPSNVIAGGGTVTLTVRVRNATKCVFGGAGTATVGCTSGRAVTTDNLVANSTAVAKSSRLWVYARGSGGTTARKYVTITEAPAATKCSGPCKFTFATPTDEDVASVQLNSVAQAVNCPDSQNFFLCEASTSQQIDDVNVTVCAGPKGITDGEFERTNFSLALTTGGQAGDDDVTFDSNVPSAFGNIGAVGPGQCVTGDIYYDVPGGAQWTSLNYSYESGLNQLVYVWT